jgi:hypothetical protein
MTISIARSAFVVKGGQQVSLSQVFGVTASSANPAYLVVSGLDRNEYTATATGATGTLSGNGATDAFAAGSGDFRDAGIVFTYNAATGQYVNSTYGSLSTLEYTVSASANDLTSLSVYGFNSASLANAYATNPAALMQLAAMGDASYIGSADFSTESSASAPTQATPDSIVSAADSMVGAAWNEEGCWVLASTIATKAGAALPVTSTVVGLPGAASGEWFVAYDGPVSASGNWESQVHAGEVVSFETGSGGGHIVTVVAGSGSSAEIVDNVQYVGSNGQTLNPANDGSASDVLISAPHLFSQELSGVSASNVVVYELDTPVVTADAASATLGLRATDPLSALFTAADPKGTGIAAYQVYETNAADSITVGGVTSAPTSAATADTAASLGAITLDASNTAGTDTLEVRAYNGSYWGDWTSETVDVSGQSAPVLALQTAAQSWTAGQAVSLNLKGVFNDPQGQALSLAVTQSNGSALPSGLTFNAATDVLSGTAPLTLGTLGLQVTATDTGGLSTSEVFQATIKPAAIPAPVLAQQTAAQVWRDGSYVSLTLPSGTFTDAGNALSYSAYEISGPNVTGWLGFNPGSDTLSGFVPARESGTVGLEVVATNSAGRSATDAFTVRFAAVGALVPSQYV